MRIARQNHTWRRFWCKPEESYSLGDAGFLIDPEADYGKYLQPHAVATEALREFPCVVLLGEPGMGKSTALVHERSNLAAEGHAAIVIELLREATADRIKHILEETPSFVRWKTSDDILYLFLDALDEGLTRNTSLADEIVALCTSLDVLRLRLRISCRTLEWPGSLEERLAARWSGGFAKYELLPLRRLDVAVAAADYEIDPDAFVKEVIARDAQPLATRPISLRFLLQTFLIDGRLPESKLRLYDEGCRLLCSDESTWERGRPTPDAFRRMAVAARIAAAVTFTNHQMIIRAGSANSDAIDVSKLIGGVEKVHGTTYEVNSDVLADSLQGSALFSARSNDSFGWAHQSHREFLAAWYLAHRELEPTIVESLYFRQQGPVPTPLREVAAWHATLVPAVFDMILARDPDVLMRSDTAAVSAPVRRALVNALLVRMDEFQAHDRSYNYDDYQRLDHPGLPDQLRPYLHGKEKNVIVRRAAIDIAGACKVLNLAPDLISLLRDREEKMQVREAAARALRALDTEDARAIFIEALRGEMEPDPDDQILGIALRALWPKHIDGTALFAALRFPKRTNFHGSYLSFLYDLPETIDAEDLYPALSWVTRTVDAFEFSTISRLRDHIIAIALTHLEDAGTAKAVAQIALATFARHHDFFGRRARRRDSSEVREALTTERRHLLLEAMLEHGAYDEKLGFRLIFNDPPLLERTDLEWLTSHATPDADAPHEAAFAGLAKQLYMRFGYPTEAIEADSVAQASEISALFRGALAPFLDPIDLGSQRAFELRAAWEAAEKNRQKFERRQEVDSEEVARFEQRLASARNVLVRIDSGEVSAWPALYFTMSDGGFEPVNQTDVWPRLESGEQERVLEAARLFLEMPIEPDQAWLDTNSVPGVAFAAEAALALLASDTRASLDTLTDEAWRRWVYVLFGLAPHDQAIVRERLIPYALTRCLPQAVSSFIRVIRRDNRLHGFVTGLGLLQPPLPVEAQQALLGVLDELSDRSWQSVIALLIESGNAEAVAIALAALDGAKPTRAAVAAYVALSHRPDRWSNVMTRMQRDRDFAVAFMDAFVDADDVPTSSPLRTLDEMGTAELFLTLLRIFPPEEDPKRNTMEMTPVTSRDQIARTRDRLVNALADRGSVKALQWLVEQEPEREYLRWMLVEARSRRADTTWEPFELEEFLRRTGVLVGIVTDSSDQVSVAFALPFATPAQAAESLRRALPGLTVESGQSALYATGSDDVIRELVKMAERDVLRVGENRLLGIRSGSEWLFEAVPAVKPREIKQRDASPDELRRLLKEIDVLLMTATPRETDAVLSAMSPLSGESALVIGTLSIDSYTVGKLGRYAVAHCQSGMGSSAADGSMATTCDAIREVEPKIIFLVGIAFGVKRGDQRIGDVLIAKHIRSYGMYKAKPETIEERGYTIPASVQLMKWMQDRTREWRFLRADGSPVRIIPPGEVLSGEVLVNNISFRNWLTDRFPTAIGGEMEGIGAYAANHRYGISHMLLVKAICDWADNCKNDRAQPFAAAAAVSAVEYLLNRPHILAPLGVEMAT